ncbi:MAG TPA: hypothetical protein VEK57_10925 [Thermoanaerobaculia bacterium]|nr:hypothetical protein [Thermoanaerobaculia bacterium]
MSPLRSNAVRLFSALLMLAMLSAGHQHPLVPPAGTLVVSQPDGAISATSKAADCVACRTLQSSDLGAAAPAVLAAVAADESFLLHESARPVGQAWSRRSPRAPPRA